MKNIQLNTKYTDIDVIQRVLAGEPSLFEIIIRRYNPYLHKTGMSFGFSHEDTQDLMQESFVSAYFHLSSFEHRSSFKTWLIRIMIRQCIRKKQKWTYQHEVALPLPDQSVPMFSAHPQRDLHQLFIQGELKEVIEKALLDLPEDYRLVFVMREINGLTQAEASDVLGISETNVKVRLHRARLMLRKGIEHVYSAEDLFEFHLKYCELMVGRVMIEIETMSN